MSHGAQDFRKDAPCNNRRIAVPLRTIRRCKGTPAQLALFRILCSSYRLLTRIQKNSAIRTGQPKSISWQDFVSVVDGFLCDGFNYDIARTFESFCRAFEYIPLVLFGVDLQQVDAKNISQNIIEGVAVHGDGSLSACFINLPIQRNRALAESYGSVLAADGGMYCCDLVGAVESTIAQQSRKDGWRWLKGKHPVRFSRERLIKTKYADVCSHVDNAIHRFFGYLRKVVTAIIPDFQIRNELHAG